MTCPHCGSELPEGLQICFRCGKSLTQLAEQKNGDICPCCGKSLPPGLSVCFYCGQSLNVAVQVSPPPVISPERKRHRGGLAVLITNLSLVFLLGIVVGGHFLGLYELPLLPTRGEPAPSGSITAPSPTDELPAATGGEESSAPPDDNVQPDDVTPSENVSIDAEIDETGFISAFFGYEVSEDNVLTAIRHVLVEFEPGIAANLTFSDFSDFRLTRDGVEEPVYIDDMNVGDDPDMLFLRLTNPLTEPGVYELSFTLFGKTRQTLGGSSIGNTVPTQEPQFTAPEYMDRFLILDNIEVSIDPDDPFHAFITLKGFPMPEWVFQAGEKDDPATGVNWSVFFSDKGGVLYRVVAERWLRADERFDEATCGLKSIIYRNYDSFDSYTNIAAHCPIVGVDGESVSWELTLHGEEKVDFTKLLYIGYEVLEYNVRDPEVRSYENLGDRWSEIGEITLSEYYKDLHGQ